MELIRADNPISGEALTAVEARNLLEKQRRKYEDLAREYVLPRVYAAVKEHIRTDIASDTVAFTMPAGVVHNDAYQKRELRRATVACLQKDGYKVRQNRRYFDILYISWGDPVIKIK